MPNWNLCSFQPQLNNQSLPPEKCREHLPVPLLFALAYASPYMFILCLSFLWYVKTELRLTIFIISSTTEERFSLQKAKIRKEITKTKARWNSWNVSRVVIIENCLRFFACVSIQIYQFVKLENNLQKHAIIIMKNRTSRTSMVIMVFIHSNSNS